MTTPGTSADLLVAVEGIAATHRLLVVVDFDGTLAPIVEDPSEARPLPGAVEALGVLAALPRTHVAVVSGRSLQDLVDRAELPASVRLVGSHGMEHEPGVIEGLDADALARRETLRSAVRGLVGCVPGVRIEDKVAGAAVHVRQASREDAQRALHVVRTAVEALPGVHTTEGHEVLELSVVETGKGAAVEQLRARTAATAVLAAGDDVTDESMMEVLRDGDVGIRVGAGTTSAAHRVADPAALADVLARLVDLRRSAG
jgi:trehalose-phosphatase